MWKGKYFKIFVWVLLVLELTYSSTQHYHEPIDGDVSNIVFGYTEVLNDPFGLTVLLEDSRHANPNRFFAHYFMSGYVKNMPLILQKVFDPIDSIYLSFALIKICLQILIIFICSAYISGTRSIRDPQFLMATLLVFPLLLMTQFNDYIGIVLNSITYTFFYTVPLLVLMLVLFPLYKHRSNNYSNQIGIVQWLIFITALIMLSFSGPLMPPVIVIIASSILTYHFLNSYKRDRPMFSKIMFMAILSVVVAFYSFYIGSHNTENTAITIGQRYGLFFNGLFNQLTNKLCVPLLLGVIIANLFLINNKKNEDSKKIMKTAGLILLPALVYLILLPFGGYRTYRPNIVSADTLMPITLILIYLFGKTTLYLLNHISTSKIKVYKWAIASCLLYFIIADEPNWRKNDCERNALQKMAKVTDDTLILDHNCTVLSWAKMETYGQSRKNATLIHHWNITNKPVLYKHPK